MKPKNLAELTDEELLAEAKKMKLLSILNALTIGFLFGMVVYSIVKKSVSLFTLVPLFFGYQLMKHTKKNKELKELLKERNLK